MNFRLFLSTSTLALLLSVPARTALIVNPPLPVDRQVTVQVIQVAAGDGSNAAPLFGSAAVQAEIFGDVDTIYAQAGIDVEFKFRLGTYNSDFALTGTPGMNNPRPGDDLDLIFGDAATVGGVLDPNPLVLNLFMVRIVPRFSQTSADTANGLAFLDANGIAIWAGPNLLGFTAGRELIASVLAHEIGHNLGLDHIVETENLMQDGGAPNPGARLNATQIMLARSSDFVVVPEPSTALLLGASLVVALLRRRG